MKIQQNLVYDKNSGDLVGYVDLWDPDLNYASFKNQDDLATPVLVFYVTGLTSKLKFELGYLATKGILSYQIMCTFRRAVMILENTCNLCVIAVVSDGASCNRSFIKLHIVRHPRPDFLVNPDIQTEWNFIAEFDNISLLEHKSSCCRSGMLGQIFL